MRAGLLTQTVDILRSERVKDKFGATAATWTAVATGLHARVTYGQGSLGVSQGEQVYRQTVTFQTRYTTAVTEYDRLRWQDRLYRITAIERYPERGELRLTAELITQD